MQHKNTEKLFSYGTLQYESVQKATFGRTLQGNPDVLSGYDLGMLEIKDKNVVETSGDATHPIIKYTGNQSHKVSGYVFDVTPEELNHADVYEADEYKRISVLLESGVKAWVYVGAQSNV